MDKIRIAYFSSSPETSPILDALTDSVQCTVVGIVEKPGKGLRVHTNAAKPVLRPKKITDATFLEQMRTLNADIGLVVSYGKILPEEVLSLPKYGMVNVHYSLLPKYRGASPITATLLAGDLETGISYFVMDAGLDTGPLIGQTPVPILNDDTHTVLWKRATAIAAKEIESILASYVRGKTTPTAQRGEPSMTKPLARDDGLISFTRTAAQIERSIRALEPWPGTFTFWNGKRLVVHRARVLPGHAGVPGYVAMHEQYPVIATGNGGLVCLELQLEGKKRLPADVFIRGARGFSGSRLPS